MTRRRAIARPLLHVLLLAAGFQLSAEILSAGQPEGGAQPQRLLFQQHTFPNGLRLLMLEDHSAPVTNLQVWYHVGSKDEKPGRTGFAHLFEHLMFKGSAHVGPDEHSRIVEAAGGFDNAYTNDDVTVYWETFPANYLERVIWLEADRMGSLNVDEANFKSEREVVKEERRVSVENRPYGRLFEDLAEVAFTVHPYKHTTIGSMADLNRATLEDVREFHRTYYRPDNATIVIVGDFRAPQATSWTERYFSGIPKPSSPVPRVTTKEPPQKAERRLTKWYDSQSPLPAVVEAYHMPAEYTADSYPLILASNILSGGESSRLYRKLVYEQQIAVETAGIGNFTEDPNLFIVYAIMNPGKSASEGVKALEAILDGMRRKPVEPKELEKAKNQQLSAYILGRQTDQQKADALGRASVVGHNPDLVNTSLNRFLSVSAADIERAARQYLDDSQRTLMLIQPPAPAAK
jgi:zinc protease